MIPTLPVMSPEWTKGAQVWPSVWWLQMATFSIPIILTLKVLNFWKFTSYCSSKPLWSDMGEVVPARTSPTLHPPSPPTVHQLSSLALQELTHTDANSTKRSIFITECWNKGLSCSHVPYSLSIYKTTAWSMAKLAKNLFWSSDCSNQWWWKAILKFRLLKSVSYYNDADQS